MFTSVSAAKTHPGSQQRGSGVFEAALGTVWPVGQTLLPLQAGLPVL